MSWTDERVELLTKMWGEGQSASQIAKELGGVTRNAVIGKVHRLGLSNRATSTTKPDAKVKSAPKEEVKSSAPSEATIKEPEAKAPISPARRQIIPAGQPLPPQPSANESSPEALAKVSEVEKKAKKISHGSSEEANNTQRPSKVLSKTVPEMHLEAPNGSN